MLNEHVRRALVAEHAADMERAASIQRMIVASRQESGSVRRRFITARRRNRRTVVAKGNLVLR